MQQTVSENSAREFSFWSIVISARHFHKEPPVKALSEKILTFKNKDQLKENQYLQQTVSENSAAISGSRKSRRLQRFRENLTFKNKDQLKEKN